MDSDQMDELREWLALKLDPMAFDIVYVRQQGPRQAELWARRRKWAYADAETFIEMVLEANETTRMLQANSTKEVQ